MSSRCALCPATIHVCKLTHSQVGTGLTALGISRQSLEGLGVYALDITGDELGKTHAKHLAGGRPGILQGERIIRFEFPENAGGVSPV